MLGKTDIKRKRKMKGPAESSHAVGSHLLQQLLLQLHTRGKTLRCCCSCFLQPTGQRDILPLIQGHTQSLWQRREQHPNSRLVPEISCPKTTPPLFFFGSKSFSHTASPQVGQAQPSTGFDGTWGISGCSNSCHAGKLISKLK